MLEKQDTHVIVLAGGKGTRMRSDEQKSLKKLGERSFLDRIVSSVLPVCPVPTIIVGHRKDAVMEELGPDFNYIWQKEQLGTGHAIQVAKDVLEPTTAQEVIVLYGDAPFVSTETVTRLRDTHREKGAVVTLATVSVPSFEGQYAPFEHFGRIIRNAEGVVTGIVEYKDATEEEKLITEVNPAYYCFDAVWLWKNIEKLSNDNASGEYYLTDLIHIAFEQRESVYPYVIENPMEGLGINTPDHLNVAEGYLGTKGDR